MKRFSFTILLFAITIQTYAYNFKVDDLCYNITSYYEPYTVEVTYDGNNYSLLEEVKIPDTVSYNGISYAVTGIGREAFKSSPLTSVTIPNSVKYLRYHSFAYCRSLSSIVIPKSVEEIQSAAFQYCNSLKDITIENGVKKISAYVFNGCSALSSIIIPNTVTAIGEEAFRGCDSLSSITLSDSLKSIESSTFWYCPSLTSIIIPNSVTSIGSYAFRDCTSLTTITIPNSVTNIGGHVFDGCSALTVPVYNANCFAYMPISYKGVYSIPEGIKQIASSAFANCLDLTSITIPNSVSSIGSSAFLNCSSLVAITIPNGITSIENNTFEGCSSLSTITIGSNVTNIQNSAFNRCPSLSSIVWNAKNCADASRYNYAPFYDIHSQITSFTLGDSVKNIPAYLCYGMSKLSSMTIPNSVTSIGRFAFENCESLKEVICYAKEVPTMGNSIFIGTPQNEATLYVPADALENYKAAYQWKEFGTILPINEASTDLSNSPIISSHDNQKIIRNGQLLILCDGKMYNVMGNEL